MLRTRADYTPVTVVSPVDGELITVYNLDRSKVSAVNEVDTTATSARKQTVHGLRDSRSTRACQAVRRSSAGPRPTADLTVQCDEPDNPNNDRYCDQRDTGVPYRTQLKVAGTYPLPCGAFR